MAMRKILVIDYDQSSLASLQGILTNEGYQVVTAADGQAGWDKYNKESPDLVLMEAMLPKVHGFELCQRITSERNSQATVFMMTGVYKDRVYRTEALRTYGAAEYFEKPLKMAELLASIQAVIGKPEPKPVEPKPAPAPPAPPKPVQEIRPEAVLVEPRRPEKLKPARDEFALPADLDMLSKEHPKIRKPVPARPEATMETRLESLADEILKTVVAEPVPHKAVAEKPKDHNGNGHESADIDQFIKSALAGFDLSQEKVKVPKTAPLPPPPPPAVNPRPTPPPPPPPAVAAERHVEKPKPAPQPPIVERPKAAPAPQPPSSVAERPVEKPKAVPPPPPPQYVFSQTVQASSSVKLTPGDPGSDVSPFFTPEKPKPAKPREAAPAPVAYRPVEKPKVQAPPPPPVSAAPAPKPPKAEVKATEKAAPTEMFTDLVETKPKKPFSPVIAAGVGIAVLAAAGFFILRPKKPAATVDDGLKAQQTIVQTNVPEKPVEEPPAPEPKPKPAAPRPKVETQTKVAEIGPSSEDAILLPSTPVTVPPVPLARPAAADNKSSNAGETAGGTAAQADPPPVKTEENPGQAAAAETGGSSDPGTTAAAPPVTPVKEGDLVDMASVDEQPRTLKSVDPAYPASAQRLGVEGSITVNALIDETGSVIDTGILKGLKDDRGLGKAAETAVKKWKFQPARKGGVNVKVWKPIVITFKAGGNAARMVE